VSPAQRAPLIGDGDPSPIAVTNERGRANVMLIGDHAGNAIPASLGDLGVSADDRRRHIAWDLGVQGLGDELASRLDATFISQRFSRLVIDCNRDPSSPRAIVEVSDETPVPGNRALDDASRDERRALIHAPYQARIATELATRLARGHRPVIVALHSFTPVLGANPRPWQLGVLHDAGDTRLSQAMLKRLRQVSSLTVGDNEPYRMDGTDYTIPRHAYPNGAPYLEIEFRQDLLSNSADCSRWATRFAGWLTDAIAEL
jgi:predicted N-formylglutamate amidohydrolase